nr:hypothetical protein [Bacteroidaceae bacterium]
AIEKDGSIYALKDAAFAENVYGATYTMGGAAAEYEYNYEIVENAVFYGEVENIFKEGSYANKAENISVLSNGGGYSCMGTSGYATLTFSVPAEAVYKLELGMNNTNSKARGFNYSIDGADVSETIDVAAGTPYVQEIADQSLTAGEHTLTLNITYSLTPIFDYLLITKTGEVTPTAINTVKSAEAQSTECFNIAGQRVAQPTKGLYIMNGRKVVVK